VRMYRTVRAWSSIGAPERTAAGRTSVSSLPFMTLFGTGENVLRRDELASMILNRADCPSLGDQLTTKLDRPLPYSLAGYV
jgi:hypothetical protein